MNENQNEITNNPTSIQPEAVNPAPEVVPEEMVTPTSPVVETPVYEPSVNAQPSISNDPVTLEQSTPSQESIVEKQTQTIEVPETEETPTSKEAPTEEVAEPKKEKKNKKKKKQKDGGSGYGCASFLFLVILCLVAYILFDKGIVTYNKDTNEFKFMPEQKIEENTNPVVEDKEDDTAYYVSSDGKYFLVLGHENKYFTSTTSQDQKHFILDIHEDTSHDLIAGGYQIENGKITLVVASGCQADNGDFNCKLPANAAVNNIGGINTIVLNYTKDKIMLGNIELTNEKNLTES